MIAAGKPQEGTRRKVKSQKDTVGEIVEIVYGLRKRATITAEFARRDRCF